MFYIVNHVEAKSDIKVYEIFMTDISCFSSVAQRSQKPFSGLAHKFLRQLASNAKWVCCTVYRVVGPWVRHLRLPPLSQTSIQGGAAINVLWWKKTPLNLSFTLYRKNNGPSIQLRTHMTPTLFDGLWVWHLCPELDTLSFLYFLFLLSFIFSIFMPCKASL